MVGGQKFLSPANLIPTFFLKFFFFSSTSSKNVSDQFRNLGHQNQDLPNQSEFGSVNRPHGFFDLTSISNELDCIHLSQNEAAGLSNQQGKYLISIRKNRIKIMKK